MKDLAASRVVIEGVEPLIDGGRFAVKRVENEPLTVTADIFSDGHEIIAAALVTHGGEVEGLETPFAFIGNDRWGATVRFATPGPYRYSIIAWRDVFGTWASDTKKKRDAGVDIALELREGEAILEQAAESGRGSREDAKALKALRARVEKFRKLKDEAALYAVFTEAETIELLRRCGVRANLSRYPVQVPVWVDREAAGF
ncbi:maltotransferase domain-containing protein, partial [Aureimonas ureilytica]|uniref:maltotransferase domain-containing protein n=1 Tax=Aureimonas ureilytica TaxID=401562 RepID=UPI000B17D29E